MTYFDILSGNIGSGPSPFIRCIPLFTPPHHCGGDFTNFCAGTRPFGSGETGTVIDDEAVKAAYVRLIEAEIDVLKSVQRVLSESKKEMGFYGRTSWSPITEPASISFRSQPPSRPVSPDCRFKACRSRRHATGPGCSRGEWIRTAKSERPRRA